MKRILLILFSAAAISANAQIEGRADWAYIVTSGIFHER
jgi:hypothetical protein